MNIFGFESMMGTHDYREVAHYEQNGVVVDTARVNDGEHPIETAVSHVDYNDGRWVIVAAYDTVEDAKKGHAEWVEKMTTEPLPDKLVDCGNSNISTLAELFGVEMEFPRKKGNKGGDKNDGR